MRPRPQPPVRRLHTLHARATRGAWWIFSTCSMPNAPSSWTRTAWRSRAPMPRPASLRFTKRSAAVGRVRPCPVMSARPGAKPLIRGRRQRSARAPEAGLEAAITSRPAPPPLSLKIEPAPDKDRSGLRRGRLSGLRQPRRARADMNANVAVLEPQAESGPCARELQRINESLQARESLLTASARASRLLLEAPDVGAAIPGVLGLIGEAARVDRVNLMQTRTGEHGEPLLVLMSEWTGEGVTPSRPEATPCTCDERNYAAVCAELRAGRSVCFSKSEISPGPAPGTAFSAIEGVGTQTKAIVPIFVAGEFIGVVGFDNTRQHRAIDSSELAALETA